VIFFPFDPSVPSSPRSGLPISYAMAHRKLLNLEIIHINFFFFECKETPLSNLPLSGKCILYPGYSRLLQEMHILTLTQDLLCRSHATPLENIHIKYIINWQVNLRFI
jgi:hypothetical protein